MPRRKDAFNLDEGIEAVVEESPLVRKGEVVQEPEEIVSLLPMGTNLPLMPEFEKYILFDINHFHARSLVIKEKAKPVGHAVIFYIDKKILYFGFFGVAEDARERIELLIDELIAFGRKEGFETLKGPVNVPTIIFGWGFMEEGSSKSQIVHKPVNSPMYPQVFRKKGFSEVLRETSFEGSFDRSTTSFAKVDGFDDYELVVFETWEEVANIKVEFLKLNVKNLDPRSVVTPSSAVVFDNYLEFIKQYGDPSMMVFTRFKKTSKFIGCLFATPNPFDKHSCVFFAMVVDKKHRNKGVGWWMMDKLINNCLEIGISSCIGITGNHVKYTKHICEKLGWKAKRTHTVFTYSLRDVATNHHISIRDRLERVSELLGEKQNEKASLLVKELLEIEPESDEGWLLLGISYRRRGNLDGAIECFQKVLRLNSSMEEVWGLLAITYLDKGQEKEAKNCLSNAVLKNPASEELKFYAQNLIRIYKAFGPFF
jgi:GNAT superfamily N-acetyltransferase